MTERSIVDAAARLRRHGEPYLVATVVCVEGHAYRRPGARMLLTRFRWVAGAVTGGCLEGDISNKGWTLTKDGAPVLVSYDSTALPDGAGDDDIRSAFGLGGDGIVQVLLERAGGPGRIDALEFSARCLRTQRRGAVTTVYRSTDASIRVGARLALAAHGELEQECDPLPASVRDVIELDMKIVLETGVSTNLSYATPLGSIEVLIEVVEPPPRLFLFGSGHDAVPVAQLARQVGWDVVVCVAQPKYSIRERFTMADEVLVGSPDEIAARISDSHRAVAVVMAHDYERDREMLGMLVKTRASYISVLGPRLRTQRMVAELGCADDVRIHAPVTSQLGAETPQELALAIVSEIQGALAHVAMTSLRAHVGPHHHDRASASGSAATVAAGPVR